MMNIKQIRAFCFPKQPDGDVDVDEDAAGQVDFAGALAPDHHDDAAVVGPIGPGLWGAAAFAGQRSFYVQVSKNPVINSF